MSGDPESIETLSLRFSSSPNCVRGALATLKAFLTEQRVPQDMTMNAEIVTAELLNNIVEHAYKEDPNGTIWLDAGLCLDCLCVKVRDEGVKMPDDTLPSGQLPPSDGPLESLPEGGFGWYLLHSLTEKLRYTRAQTMNITEFVLPKSSG